MKAQNVRTNYKNVEKRIKIVILSSFLYHHRSYICISQLNSELHFLFILIVIVIVIIISCQDTRHRSQEEL